MEEGRKETGRRTEGDRKEDGRRTKVGRKEDGRKPERGRRKDGRRMDEFKMTSLSFKHSMFKILTSRHKLCIYMKYIHI